MDGMNSMNGKRHSIFLFASPVVYVLLFFLWAPAHMVAIRWHAYFLVTAIDGYDKVAHQWWVAYLGQDNWLVKVRVANTIWWCRKFEACKVQ